MLPPATSESPTNSAGSDGSHGSDSGAVSDTPSDVPDRPPLRPYSADNYLDMIYHGFPHLEKEGADYVARGIYRSMLQDKWMIGRKQWLQKFGDWMV